MKASLAIAVAITTLSGLAWAQTGVTPAQSTAQATSAPAPTVPASDKTVPTVSGLTVVPLLRKPCAPRDKECISLVIAQVKELYPEQLKTFCFQQSMIAARRDMQAQIAGWCEGPGQGASAICSHYVEPVVKQACAKDKK